MDPSRFPVETASPRGFRQAYVRARSRETGDDRAATALLLVHGWPETSRIWWRNIGALSRAGFDVIAPDLRGSGRSDPGPDGYHDVVSHSRDLYALVHDELGIDSVVAVGGDLGGAVIQDLSLRFPGFVDRMVIFNAPLPYLKQEMQGLRTRPPDEEMDYFLRQANDADGLAAELGSEAARRAYVAAFYTSRRWAHPGHFEPEAVDFMTEPFADPVKLRAGFGGYESALHESARVGRPFWQRNPTPTMILHGPSDRVTPPDFPEMARCVFDDHQGPFRVPAAGHFLQWEAHHFLNGEIATFCRDRLAARRLEAGAEACIALGSNLGPREEHIVAAITALRKTAGVDVMAVSPVYETDPVGPPPQRPYLNAALRLRTSLEPRALLGRLHEIEAQRGRTRGPERDVARTLDLDLLLYADRVVDEPDLRVPHPRLHERAFALEPLCQVAPRWVHPGAREPIEVLAARVRDPDAVRRREGSH